GLRLAVDVERDRRREGVDRAAVEPDVLLAAESELDRHHFAGRAGAAFGIPGDIAYFGIREARSLKNGNIEVRGLLGLAIEPQERRDLLHGYSRGCPEVRVLAAASNSRFKSLNTQ